MPFRPLFERVSEDIRRGQPHSMLSKTKWRVEIDRLKAHDVLTSKQADELLFTLWAGAVGKKRRKVRKHRKAGR